MRYSEEQRNAIEKVKKVFDEYIRGCKELDLLWSDKLGYILILGIDETMDDFCMHPIVISDPRELCKHVLDEIAFDIIKKGEKFHDIQESSPLEEKLIREAYYPYMKYLPEYSELIVEVFIDSFEEC